jgi:hypothetical protein
MSFTKISATVVVAFIAFKLLMVPSNDRVWNVDQEVLPYATINQNLVLVYNIRDFTYASTTSFTPRYYDKTFDVNKITRAWYVVEPFSGIPGSAHTFLSFEFEKDVFVSISVEIRKEKGESFHPVKGLFDQYELMYVIGDEKDLIKLRTNYRKDKVFLYPIKAEVEDVRALFLDMIERTNKLKDQPEFYNTLTNTCTTNIVSHVNKLRNEDIFLLNPKILFPEYSDALAFKLGLIDTDLSFEQARRKYLINEKALKYADSPDFSRKIRNN